MLPETEVLYSGSQRCPLVPHHVVHMSGGTECPAAPNTLHVTRNWGCALLQHQRLHDGLALG